MNARPAFNNNSALLLRFRELEGKPAGLDISSAIPGKTIKKITEVNSTGKALGVAVKSLKLNPYEVKFVEVEF